MIVASDYDKTYNRMSPNQKDEVDIIITAENWDDFPNIEAEGNSNIPIFFNPGKQDFTSVIAHKSRIINETGANIFWDDDTTLIAPLRLLCKNCSIRLFKGEGDI